jgi:hypothetical protein
MTAIRLEARKLLVCSRSSVGSASMMRSMVLVALVVCSVPEHQVPGFRGRHRHGNRFGVAHFADQNHIRILAHGGAHAFGEGGQVRAQLALDDLARFAAMDEFDRIFEADDVERARRIQVIDHRGERGGFAGAGGARDQNHALVVIAELAHDGGQTQLIHARHLKSESTGRRRRYRSPCGTR